VLAGIKMGNKGDLNSKNLHDSRWSNESGDTRDGRQGYSIQTNGAIHEMCVYYIERDATLWLIVSELN
jgi:hypothetical protein